MAVNLSGPPNAALGALFIGYPAWQLYLLLLALAAAVAFGVYRLVRVVSAWREIRFLRDANIAVGHSLQRIASNHGRVYHDVVTAAGVVDHVILGGAPLFHILGQTCSLSTVVVGGGATGPCGRRDRRR